MDKGKELAEDSRESYYQMDTYEEGTSQTLSFKPETYQKIQNEKEELSVKKIFKINWFERNKEIRYIAQKHENIIDTTSVNGRAKISLITDEIIKRELRKLSTKEAKKYRNIYFGGVEFTIKAYFQRNIDTPIQIYILDDRILGNLQDALISVIKGNLIYQKLKFTVQPDFSISLKDEHKELALTLYYKLDGIKMPPGSKVISIETKMIYALTGNHHVTKQHELNILVPKMYQEILEQIEHKENSQITIPEEIYMDFNTRTIKPPNKIIPRIEGSRLSFRKEPSTSRPPMISRQYSLPRLINLIDISTDRLKIKVIIFEGIIAKDCIAEINTGAIKSFIHINKINGNECCIIDPQTYNYPENEREIIITKSINLRFKIQDLEYNINIGVIEYDSSNELLLGSDFLTMIKYKINNNGIEINDQGKIRFISKV